MRVVDRRLLEFDPKDKDLPGLLRAADALGYGAHGSSSSAVAAILPTGDVFNYSVFGSHLREKVAAKRREIAALDLEDAELSSRLDVLKQFKKCVAPWVLTRPTESFLHSMLEARAAGRLHLFDREFEPLGKVENPANIDGVDAHVFVVEHDWAAAFAKSDVDQGEIKLPYATSAFEFVLNGVHLIVLAKSIDDAIVYVKAGKSWGGILERGAWPYLMKQIRCICIALDAQVAVTEVIRAPHRLNQARIDRGKLPVFDHHVVSLARRTRPARLEASEPMGKHKRLHWRRGHWRHYEEHKTWINWMLVGDPDMGFVDKHYRL